MRGSPIFPKHDKLARLFYWFGKRAVQVIKRTLIIFSALTILAHGLSSAQESVPVPDLPEPPSALVEEAPTITVGAYYWMAPLSPFIRGDNRGVAGDRINASDDLNLVSDIGIPGITASATLKNRHIFSFDMFLMTYTGDKTLENDLVFNGVRYPAYSHPSTTIDIISGGLDYNYAFDLNEKGYLAAKATVKYVSITTAVVTDETPSNGYSKMLILPGLGGSMKVIWNEYITIDLDLSALPMGGAQFYDTSLTLIGTISKDMAGSVGWRRYKVSENSEGQLIDFIWSGPFATFELAF